MTPTDTSYLGCSDATDEELRVPTPLLRLLVDNWPDPVILLNNDRQIVFASKRAEQVLGYSTGQLTDLQSAHETLCAHSLRGESHSEHDCPLMADIDERWRSCWWQKAAGEYLSVDVRTQPLALDANEPLIVCSFIDNSERRHNQTELDKFACLIQLNPTALAEFDGFGQLVFANDAMQSLMIEAGFDEDGMCRVLPKQVNILAQSMLAGELCDEGHCEQVCAGEKVYEWRLQPFRAPGVEPTLLGCVFDITEQMRYQEAVEAAKIAARRDFYAKVVHEIRTPLNAILGFSNLLLRRTSDKLTDRERDNLRAINRAGFQLSEWVTDTLDAAKIDAGQMDVTYESFETHELVDQFWGQIESLASAKGLHLTQVVEPVTVVADRQKVRQICINLLSNAVKYTTRGDVELRVYQAQNELVISVQDSGPGFSDEQKAQLFQSYKMIADDSRQGVQGTGLGLVFVRELVAMHHGVIDLESEAGAGATFLVRIPLTPPTEQ